MINYENELNKFFSGEPQEYVTADKFNMLLSEGFRECDLNFFKNCKCDGINDYIWFVSPFESSQNDMVDEIKASYFFVKEGFKHDIIMQNHYIPECNEGYPFEFYPGEKCILPWAQCDNGTVFYWRIENGKWSILVYGESDTFYEYDMTIYEFLYKLVNGEIDNMSEYLPDDLFKNGIICCQFNNLKRAVKTALTNLQKAFQKVIKKQQEEIYFFWHKFLKTTPLINVYNLEVADYNTTMLVMKLFWCIITLEITAQTLQVKLLGKVERQNVLMLKIHREEMVI